MQTFLAQISLVVDEYDRALEFYVGKLGFQLIEDTKLSADKRWVVVRPSADNARGADILLAKAVNVEQRAVIGKQAGGRVFLFLATDNVQRDYQALHAKGVEFVQKPTEQPYGTVAIFKDLYGHHWDLIQHAPEHRLFTR